MNGILIVIFIGILIHSVIQSFRRQSKTKKDRYFPQKHTSGRAFSSVYPNYLPPRHDGKTIAWCARLLGSTEEELKKILLNIPRQYTQFSIRKRSGGRRQISVPGKELLRIQRTIYQRILMPVNIHPAATGFRKRVSIVDNARQHLGNKEIFKTDIRQFFSSIRYHKVVQAFEKIGYPKKVSQLLASLCCLHSRLPQGAPTSPALSNIIAYEMDQKLTILSHQHRLIYTRYADDLTFSGNDIDRKELYMAVKKIVEEDDFVLKKEKTHFLSENKRKIITGVSVSSGHKLTIPRAKKREMRKNVHYILTKGLGAHQRHIGSTDPAYLKRTLGYLHFWLSVEPDNRYVADSIRALQRLQG